MDSDDDDGDDDGDHNDDYDYDDDDDDAGRWSRAVTGTWSWRSRTPRAATSSPPCGGSPWSEVGSGQLVMLAASTDTINTGHAFVLVFNISSKQSLTELKPIVELINEVRNTLNVADFQWWFVIFVTNQSNYIMAQIKGSKADCPIVLVGNKRDEEAGAREVPTTTGETLQVNIGY